MRISIDDNWYLVGGACRNLGRNPHRLVNASPEEVIEIKRVQKQHVVISFLALLELVKQNMLIAEQSENFAEIDIASSVM